MKLYPFLSHTFGLALPALAGITLIAGVAYVNDQQAWRMSANEPQEWLAQNAANNEANYNNSVPPSTPGGSSITLPTALPFLPQESVAIERDEAPYVILYDAKRAAVSGSGRLHGVLPQVPDGIFNEVNRSGVDRVTWQPEPNVRQAIVVLPIKGGPLSGGYALAGRSLAYTEWQESQLAQRWLYGWIVTIIGILISAGLVTYLRLRRADRTQ